jgi:hypothetical protein
MRWLLLLLTLPGSSDLATINQLDECVQLRFQTLQPDASGRFPLGMSRIMRPPSFGVHFVPKSDSNRDFEPETDREKEILSRMEAESLQVGFYAFGRAILDGSASDLNLRALKGPGAITRDTPRPAWYPLAPSTSPAPGDALPDWKSIYPVGQRAMRDFMAGGTGFETTIGSWRIAARRVVACQAKCVTCHNSQAYKQSSPVALHQPIGGVLYAYRRQVH